MLTVMSRLYREVLSSDLRGFDRPQVGDRIFFDLKTGEKMSVDVTCDSSGKMFFVSSDCLADRRPMGSNLTNARGWEGTEMRRFLNDALLYQFPDELREMIVPTKITQIVRGKQFVCEDKLFCLSFTQVFGTGHPDYERAKITEPDDLPLDIFRNNKSRIKCLGADGSPCWWWLRSANGTDFFRTVGNYGTSYYNTAYDSSGVALGFCIDP